MGMVGRVVPNAPRFGDDGGLGTGRPTTRMADLSIHGGLGTGRPTNRPPYHAPRFGGRDKRDPPGAFAAASMVEGAFMV